MYSLTTRLRIQFLKLQSLLYSGMTFTTSFSRSTIFIVGFHEILKPFENWIHLSPLESMKTSRYDENLFPLQPIRYDPDIKVRNRVVFASPYSNRNTTDLNSQRSERITNYLFWNHSTDASSVVFELCCPI